VADFGFWQSGALLALNTFGSFLLAAITIPLTCMTSSPRLLAAADRKTKTQVPSKDVPRCFKEVPLGRWCRWASQLSRAVSYLELLDVLPPIRRLVRTSSTGSSIVEDTQQQSPPAHVKRGSNGPSPKYATSVVSVTQGRLSDSSSTISEGPTRCLSPVEVASGSMQLAASYRTGNLPCSDPLQQLQESGDKNVHGVEPCLRMAAVVFVTTRTINAAVSMISAAVQRRHLMVWALFAPKFVFDAFILLVCDVCVIVSCWLAL
jgi:hypothetical protein